MKRNFYRSLDRPMDLFGLRGRWIRTFLVMLGICGAPALIAAVLSGVGMMVAVLLGGGGLCFITCMILQGKTPERRLDKLKIEGKVACHVVRRENLSRILLDSPAPPPGFSPLSVSQPDSPVVS